MKLLHCMKQAGYLESALRDGLMLTDHQVRFSPTEDRVLLGRMLNKIEPLIDRQLKSFGASLSSLSPEESRVVFSGIGSFQSSIPMLCFTEVPNGRDISSHCITFGAYGLVVSRAWIEQNGGDRVIYVGDGTAVSKHLFSLLAKVRLSGLIRGRAGSVMFENDSLAAAFDFVAHVEVRDHITQAEWRIVGGHGFMGGPRDTNKRLPLPLAEVEAVFVPDADVSHFTSLVSQLAASVGGVPPKVTEFPTSL